MRVVFRALPARVKTTHCIIPGILLSGFGVLYEVNESSVPAEVSTPLPNASAALNTHALILPVGDSSLVMVAGFAEWAS